LRNRAGNFLIGAAVAGAIMAPFTWGHLLWGVKPYYAVRVVQVERGPSGSVHITASFTKNENCKLEEFAVVGHQLGLTRFLEWSDSDGLGRSYDRMAGEQTLRIQVDPDGVDEIELRTRHNCDGKTIDRTFARIDPLITVLPGGEG
jgi:hypothetical protein